MEILGLGVDICDVARMERALDRHPTMRARVFTAEEVAYCDTKARPAESYAGRFAAREAVIKALGGYRGKGWHDISVNRAPSGAPAIRLEGNAKQRADRPNNVGRKAPPAATVVPAEAPGTAKAPGRDGVPDLDPPPVTKIAPVNKSKPRENLPKGREQNARPPAPVALPAE